MEAFKAFLPANLVQICLLQHCHFQTGFQICRTQSVILNIVYDLLYISGV